MQTQQTTRTLRSIESDPCRKWRFVYEYLAKIRDISCYFLHKRLEEALGKSVFLVLHPRTKDLTSKKALLQCGPELSEQLVVGIV